MEEDNLSRTLAFDCGHGYAQEDYAMKREREKWRRLTRLLVVFKQHAAPSAGFAPDSSISSSRLSLVIKAS